MGYHMKSVRSFYDLLEVSPEATLAEVELAYKKKQESQEASKEFHLLDAAFSEISEEQSRAVYDAVLKESDEFIKMYHEYIWARDQSIENKELKRSLLSQLVSSMKEEIHTLYAEYGIVLVECNEFDQALDAFDNYLIKYPMDATILTEKALTLCKKGLIDDGEILVRQVIRKHPNFVYALENFPKTLRQLGYREEASYFLEREIASELEREEQTLSVLLKDRIIFCYEDNEIDKAHELFKEFMTILKNLDPFFHSSFLYDGILRVLDRAGEKRLHKQLVAVLKYSELPADSLEESLRNAYDDAGQSLKTLLPLVEFLRLNNRKEEAASLIAEASKCDLREFDAVHLQLQQVMFHFEDGEQVAAYELLEILLFKVEKLISTTSKEVVIGLLDMTLEDLRQFGEHHWVQKFQNLKDELTQDDEKVVKVATREGCYIATAVYGSYEHPQVLKLRKFRDLNLRKTIAGRIFIRFYYAVSPLLVKQLVRFSVISKMLRGALDRLITLLKLD